MAEFKEHCEDCIRELGEPFEEVHKWLDALFRVLKYKHRSARHHTKGVEAIRAMYGNRAALAAEIHIKKDYGGKVPTPNESQTWSLMGPPGDGDGKTFKTDEGIIIPDNKNLC